CSRVTPRRLGSTTSHGQETVTRLYQSNDPASARCPVEGMAKVPNGLTTLRRERGSGQTSTTTSWRSSSAPRHERLPLCNLPLHPHPVKLGSPRCGNRHSHVAREPWPCDGAARALSPRETHDPADLAHQTSDKTLHET